MAKFGIPYMGSKSGIALDLINVMPSGRRFVDLFGGGFAMSHCAYLSGLFSEVYYNDINPLLVPFIQDCLDGKYRYDTFIPKFITKKEFFEKKDICGYIKYVWSFGNRGETYLYGESVEKIKEKAHDYIVFNKHDIALKPFIGNGKINNINIKDRLKEFYELMRAYKTKRLELRRIENLGCLERLHALGLLMKDSFLINNSTNIILNTGSYVDYEYQEGDIVYCDIPYKDTEKYNKKGFDHSEFYDWALSRDYPVYISSYELPKEFSCVYEKQKRSLLNSMSRKVKIERLYTNI